MRQEPMNKPVTVVVIRSLSYTGTTWFNAVLGSHQRAFAHGPPDRTFKMRREPTGESCRIHGLDCPFWSSFWATFDADKNYYLQLAAHADRDVIVINNPIPTEAGAELRHRDIIVKSIYLIRDGRALAASYRRHTKDASYLDAVTQFLWPSFGQFYFDPDNTEKLSLRYEDVLSDPATALGQVSEFLGFEYPSKALRFWEYEHHLSAGNAGTIALAKIGAGIELSDFRRREFYEQQFQEMQVKGPSAFADDAWSVELTNRERFIFDLLWGATNEAFGYERDRFNLREVAGFSDELRHSLAHESVNEGAAQALLANLEMQPSIAKVATNEPELRLSVREQLRWANLRTRGLNLSPLQVKLLGLKVILPAATAMCVLTALLILVF
ncbi:MAG: hypothetical protein ACI9BW_001154 [Gammaproteobacteria bacterium]|jgi:hypothetical protein